MRDDVAEFCRCSRSVFQLQICLAAKIGRPELRGRGVVEPTYGFQQFDGARGVAALNCDGCGGKWNLQAVCEDRLGKLFRQLA